MAEGNCGSPRVERVMCSNSVRILSNPNRHRFTQSQALSSSPTKRESELRKDFFMGAISTAFGGDDRRWQV